MNPISNEKLQAYLAMFQIEHSNYSLNPITNSHINETYLVADEHGRARYIFQRINHDVFQKPAQVMENIVVITEFMRRKVAGKYDANRQVMGVILTKEGKSYVVSEDGYFRMYDYISDAYSCDRISKPEEFWQVAVAIGRFHKLLEDFDGKKLNITIPDFHNTPKRLEGFKKVVEEDALGRAAGAQKEIQFILEREKLAKAFGGKEGLRLRVTHNDTKPSNVMLDRNTGKALCMIDLDTVMPGTICDDFGDAIRSGACKVKENGIEGYEGDYFDYDLYKVFHEAFLQECGEMLTLTEREMLPVGAMKITYEQALRFLEDYLKGDVYFKATDEKQNLRRARVQMRLLKEMEEYL